MESRRKKLERLLRSKSRGEVVSGAELVRKRGHSGVNRRTNDPLEPITLTDGCGGVESSNARGPFWLIRRKWAEVEPESAPVAGEFAKVLRGARHHFDELAASPALCHTANAQPGKLLFVDTETCGLAGSMIFLVGVMTYTEDDLVFEQLLARDYSEEAAVMQAYAERYEQCGVLVTFNGKSFDMPCIRDRWAFHGVEMPWNDPPHLDLLHESRRRWKGQLKQFKLQALERHFCGRHRTGDIPGSAIPQAYHDFVASGDARRMRDILHHNLLDLLTMAQIVTFLLTGCDPADA